MESYLYRCKQSHVNVISPRQTRPGHDPSTSPSKKSNIEPPPFVEAGERSDAHRLDRKVDVKDRIDPADDHGGKRSSPRRVRIASLMVSTLAHFGNTRSMYETDLSAGKSFQRKMMTQSWRSRYLPSPQVFGLASQELLPGSFVLVADAFLDPDPDFFCHSLSGDSSSYATTETEAWTSSSGQAGKPKRKRGLSSLGGEPEDDISTLPHSCGSTSTADGTRKKIQKRDSSDPHGDSIMKNV